MVHAFDDSQPAASAHRRTAARVFGRSASAPGGHSRIVEISTRDQRCVAASTRTTGRGVWPRRSPRTRRCAEARLDRRISALLRPTGARAQHRFSSNQARRAPPGVHERKWTRLRRPPRPRARVRADCAETRGLCFLQRLKSVVHLRINLWKPVNYCCFRYRSGCAHHSCRRMVHSSCITLLSWLDLLEWGC